MGRSVGRSGLIGSPIYARGYKKKVSVGIASRDPFYNQTALRGYPVPPEGRTQLVQGILARELDWQN